MKKIQIIALAIIACMCMSCEPDEVCRQQIHVTAGITLRGIAVDTAFVGKEFTSWDSITVQGVGNDSILYANTKNISTLRLPLRADTSGLTAFSIRWHNTDDTLYIRHDNTMQFLSMACGCIIYHTIDSTWCTTHWMDSVTILNSTVENYEQDNIKIHTTVPAW